MRALSGTRLEPWLPAVLSAWVLGVVLLSGYHLGGWFQARRLTRRDARPAAPVWTARLAELRERLGIGRAVELLESARVAVPAVVGWLRPVILVPASAFAGLAPQLRRAAGTFHYEGKFDGTKGSGTFTFEGNPAYVREMASLGYDIKADNCCNSRCLTSLRSLSTSSELSVIPKYPSNG